MECKICNKKFTNGKAVGGHMKSHFAILPLPPKSETEITDFSSKRQNKSSLVDIVVDRQSESGLRCKRAFKGMRGDEEDVQTSSMSELEMEEDAASCLVMLSRDVWRRPDELMMREKIYKCDSCNKVFKSAQGLGSHISNHHKRLKKSLSEIQNHECGFCAKVFRSAQALGGHKKMHLLESKFGNSLIDLNLSPEIQIADEQLYRF